MTARPAGEGREASLWILLCLTASLGGCGKAPEAVQPEQPQPPVETRSSVDRAVATTGDVITYRVTVDYDENYEIDLPEPGADIAGFRIIDIGSEKSRSRRGRVIEERWYQLRADLVGSYVLPPVTVGYRPRIEPPFGEGEAPPETERSFETVETSAIFVEVESVLPADGEAEDIRDLKPLHRIQRPLPWGWIAGVLLALVLLAVGVWYLRQRRRAAGMPEVPPHELAFGALESLRQSDFDDPEAVRRFHFAISEVVRAYVEGRFGLNATDLTTEEIFAGLEVLPELNVEDGLTLRLFLLGTDRVKFADHTPSEQEIEETYDGALGFVEATMPVADPEEKAA